MRRLKEVVYTLSNHNQNVMSGLWKDLPYKITKKVKENWLDNLFFLVPLVGTYQCVPVASPHRATHARVRPALGARSFSVNRRPAAAHTAALPGSPLASTAHNRRAGRGLRRLATPLPRLPVARPARRVETLGLLRARASGLLTPAPPAGTR